MVGQTISHYRIVEKLGEGGMGVVYKAEDTKLDRTVALKFLAEHLLSDTEAKQRFLREAKAAAALDHPNICHVYEIDEAEGKTFLSMAFIEGESLEARIERGPLPLKEALDIGRQIAEGLEAAHDKGIVHRDIKPANVMVDAKGRATIMDFGLARLTEASRLTKPDEAMGTVAYMSPEQAQGMEVDHRSDIWALGCVLYEMVCGQRPFKGQYDQALFYEIVNQEPEPLTGVRAGVPMELEFIVGKCLAKDTESRYRHADELAGDLKNLHEKLKTGRSTILRTANLGAGVPATLTAGQTVTSVDALPPGAVIVQQNRLRVLQAVAALAMLGLLALVFVQLTGSPPESPEKLVRRFSFTPDSLGGVPLGAAVSPDGRRIVYASGEDPSRLWVRDLDREEPRPLGGTDGAQAPFWSPDSSFIGFFAMGELRKIGADGGIPITLCQSSAVVRLGSWSPDGETIVFSQGPGFAGRLFSVPAQGGVPTDLGLERVFAPYFLPAEVAERTLLYSRLAQPVDGEDRGRVRASIHVLHLDGGESVELGEGGLPVYSFTGHILYAIRASSVLRGLWALPFSLERLEATGPPFPVAQGVISHSIARDGTLVALDVPERADRQLVWRDRAGNRLGTIGQPQVVMYRPELSPDGTKVAVYGFDDSSAGYDIWVHEVDRPIKRRLTFDAASEHHPVWSPDGREIVFSSMRQGPGDLFIVAADVGGEGRPFVESEFREAESDWSRDGRFFVYQVRTVDDSNFNLRYLVRQEDGKRFEPVPFLERPFNDVHPQISPDGRFLAYSSNESGSGQVYVRPFPGGRGVWQVSESGGNQPRWSADGRELYWVAGSTLMAAEVSTRGGFSVERIQTLFEDPNLEGGFPQYDVASDGRFVTVEDVAEGEQTESRKPAIRIIQNWYEEFRDRAQD